VNALGQFHAAHIGQSSIDEGQFVRRANLRLVIKLSQGLLPGRCHRGPNLPALEVVLEDLGIRRAVIDDDCPHVFEIDLGRFLLLRFRLF